MKAKLIFLCFPGFCFLFLTLVCLSDNIQELAFSDFSITVPAKGNYWNHKKIRMGYVITPPPYERKILSISKDPIKSLVSPEISVSGDKIICFQIKVVSYKPPGAFKMEEHLKALKRKFTRSEITSSWFGEITGGAGISYVNKRRGLKGYEWTKWVARVIVWYNPDINRIAKLTVAGNAKLCGEQVHSYSDYMEKTFIWKNWRYYAEGLPVTKAEWDQYRARLYPEVCKKYRETNKGYSILSTIREGDSYKNSLPSRLKKECTDYLYHMRCWLKLTKEMKDHWFVSEPDKFEEYLLKFDTASSELEIRKDNFSIICENYYYVFKTYLEM